MSQIQPLDLGDATFETSPKPRKKTAAEARSTDSWIDDLVGALYDCIIVYPGGWEDTIPQWMKEAITIERLAENMLAVHEGRLPTATDSEACIYLYTAFLNFAPDRDWTEIYLYVATKSVGKNRNTQIPEDIRREKLSDDQMRELKELKGWIYQQRVRHRTEKARDIRKAERQDAKKELETMQASFSFEE